MVEPVKSVLKATHEGVPPISGEIRASVWELDQGKEAKSNHIIHIDSDWFVRVRWSIEGALASCICGEWALRLYLEPLDRGPELHYPVDGDLHLPLDPCKPREDNKYWYTQDVRVPAGFIEEKHLGIPYRPVATLTYRDVCQRPGPMAGFVELPAIEFVTHVEPTVQDTMTFPAHPDDSAEVRAANGKTKVRDTDHFSELMLVDRVSDSLLTPAYLEETLAPFLVAIEQLQHILDGIEGQPKSTVQVQSIGQYSPISVDLGGAAKAVEILRDEVVPWRRKHGKKIADQKVELNDTEVKLREQQAREARAKADQEEAESTIAALRAQAELERLQLENEKLRTEIHERRIDLALRVIEKLDPDLTQQEKIRFTIDLLEPLRVLTESPLMPIGALDVEEE